jgi:resuscitation-promoting factor RpfB
VLRSVKYGLNGAVLAGLVAAPVVWNSVDKTVHLVVDGKGTAIHTTAQNVGQVLDGKGYRVSAHDLLAPSAKTHVKDGTRIVLRRGRLLHLDVDGARTDVWTTAPTVAEALAQLGYSNSDFVSVSRARRLPLGVTDIAIRTPRVITVVHDGKTEQVSTTDTTVAQLLDDLDIRLAASDRVSPARTAALGPVQTVRVQRVASKLVTRVRALPFPTRHQRSSALSVGTTKVLAEGRNGKARVTYKVVYVDGKATGWTKIKTVTVNKPQTRVLADGTRRSVTTSSGGSGGGGSSGGGSSGAPNAPAPDPGTAKAIARELLKQRGWGDDQYNCLVTLWNHESGWRVHAANPSGAYGIPQALPGSKMGSAGPDWQNNATTQIKWGLGYISSRYNTPCQAWSTWQAQGGWY